VALSGLNKEQNYIMLIFRIEDQDGGGIYRGDKSHLNPISSFSSTRHPMPVDDSKLVEGVNRIRNDGRVNSWISDVIESEGYIFGFGNTEQLRNWTYKDSWLWQLNENGFRLAVFEFDDYQDGRDFILGHTQAIFFREKARQVSYFNIAEFFGIHEDSEDDGFDTY